MSCIAFDFRKPESYEPNLQDTIRLHANRLVGEAVSAFMADPSGLLEYLDRLLRATNRLQWPNAFRDLTPTQNSSKLMQKFGTLYQAHESNPARLAKVRGVVFERIVFQLVRKKYAQQFSVCEHNVRVGLHGQPLTANTIDVAAWSTFRHESEFYECKLYIDRNVPDLEDLEPINEARTQFLTAPSGATSIAAVYTLTNEEEINLVLLPAHLKDGGLKELHDKFPDIDFKNLSALIA